MMFVHRVGEEERRGREKGHEIISIKTGSDGRVRVCKFCCSLTPPPSRVYTGMRIFA